MEWYHTLSTPPTAIADAACLDVLVQPQPQLRAVDRFFRAALPAAVHRDRFGHAPTDLTFSEEDIVGMESPRADGFDDDYLNVDDYIFFEPLEP